MKSKVCNTCNERKNLDNFHKHKGNKDGYMYSCANCAKERIRAWRIDNPEYDKKYKKKRRKEDADYRFRDNLGRTTRKIFKGLYKDSTTREILGCSFKKAKNHLIENSPRGFKWEKLGQEYHIDHIIPLAAHDLTKETHRRASCHYTNLQILTSEENLSKQASVPEGLDIEKHVEKWLEEYG